MFLRSHGESTFDYWLFSSGDFPGGSDSKASVYSGNTGETRLQKSSSSPEVFSPFPGAIGSRHLIK